MRHLTVRVATTRFHQSLRSELNPSEQMFTGSLRTASGSAHRLYWATLYRTIYSGTRLVSRANGRSFGGGRRYTTQGITWADH